MPKRMSHRPLSLTPLPVHDATTVTLDTCPNCDNHRIKKWARRKGGPSMFHCSRCGFVANIDHVLNAHWMLGHRVA